jgi:hypothetical protein
MGRCSRRQGGYQKPKFWQVYRPLARSGAGAALGCAIEVWRLVSTAMNHFGPWSRAAMAGCLLAFAVFFSGCVVYPDGAVGPGVGAGLAEAGVAAADIGMAAAAPAGFWGGWGGRWGGSFQQNNYYNDNRRGPYRHWHGGRYRGGFRGGFRR